MVTAANSINEATTGICGFTGTAFTSTPVTQYDVLVGGSTSSTISNVGPGTAGQVLQSGGNAANPVYSTATYPATAGSSGNVLTSNGTNWTSTAPVSSGTVTSVSGTTNQVAVATGTTTPVISLVGPYTPATYTAHGVLVGEGTSSIAALAAGSSGQILQSGGASADPAYSTSTYPTTNAVSTLLYASSANVMAALATANSGVLTTSSSGVPSIDTTNFVRQTTGMQMKGNNTNTAPPAGFIGEQIRSYIAGVSAVALTTATAKTITSISLTAGIWDVSAIIDIASNATTNFTAYIGSISATNNTLGALGEGDDTVRFLPPAAGLVGTSMALSIPSLRVTLSGTTTYYLVASATFTVSNAIAFGRISATRVG